MAKSKKEPKVVAIVGTANTRASGEQVREGRAYKVPSEVSERDAGILIRMGKAESVETSKVKSINDKADKAEADAAKAAEGGE